VVFDKVDENTNLVGTREDLSYGEMVDKSLNQVLMRSLNTSITALLPVASLLMLGAYVLGATTLEEFALALLVGLFAGAYSSIFIASPLLAVLKEREPRYRDIKERLQARRGDSESHVPTGRGTNLPVAGTAKAATATLDRPEAESSATPAPPRPGAAADRVIPPKPRKKGKKKR
jgi:preprotein translocase subunit SecF